MATENILQGSFTTLKELNDTVKALKASLSEMALAGKQGSDEWIKASRELNDAYTQQRTITQQVTNAAKGLQEAEEGSIVDLRQKVALLNQERNLLAIGSDQYNELTAKLKEYNDALRVAGTSAGDMRANVGNYAASMTEAIGALGKTFPGLEKGVTGLKASFTALSSNPLLVIVQLLITAFKALQDGFKGNEEASNKMASLWASLKAPLMAVKDAVVKFASVVADAFEAALPVIQQVFGWIKSAVAGIIDLYAKVTEGLGKLADFVGLDKVSSALGKVSTAMHSGADAVRDFGNELSEASKAAIRLAQAQESLAATQRKYNETLAANQSRIEELNYLIEMAKAEQDYTRALELNEEKQTLVRANAAKALAIAKEELSIAQDTIAAGDRSAEALDAESAAKVKVIQATTELNKALREATTQRTELTNSAKAQTKSEQDAVKAALAFAEAQLSALDSEEAKYKAEEFKTAIAGIKSAYEEAAASYAEEDAPSLTGWLSEESITQYYDALRTTYDTEYQMYSEMVDAQVAKIEERMRAEALSAEETESLYAQLSSLEKSRDKEYRKYTDKREAADREQTALSKKLALDNLSAIGDCLDAASGLFEQNTIAYKVTAIAKALIDTFLAVNSVLAQQAGGIVTKAAAAATIMASGLAMVAKIKSVAVGGSSSGTEASTSDVSAALSGASVSGAVVDGNLADTAGNAYTYARPLTTEQEDSDSQQPIYVTVTDIDEAQRRVKVRDTESRF